MFAKLSALALCLSLVSALSLGVPDQVSPDTTVEISVADIPDNLGTVDLVLDLAGSPAIEIAVDLTLDLNIEVYIPADITSAAGYVIDVVEHDDQANVIGVSNPFDIA